MYFNSTLSEPPSLVPKEWDELIPKAVFHEVDFNGMGLDNTRAFWRLVYMNPGLRRLIFSDDVTSAAAALMMNTSVAANGAAAFTVLAPTSESFLLSVFTRLRSLRHLKVGQHADEFLFCNLNTFFPSLESFVHSESVAFNPRTVQLEPHRNLRRLKFICTVSPGQLRAIVVAFPRLEELSVRRLHYNDLLAHRYDSNSNGTPETGLTGPQWADDLVHSSLMQLAIEDPRFVSSSCGLLRSRILYPQVTKLITNVRIRCSLDLGRVLYILPSVPSLQICGINDFNGADGEQDDTEWQWSRPFSEIWGRDHAMVEDWRIDWINLGPSSKMDAFYAQMPLLTHLNVKHCSLDGTTLSAFSRYFKNLEYIEFNLDDSFSKELLDLFVGCLKLKDCIGEGHFVMADDIINSAEWTCLQLERLAIMVTGVPRLTKLQEKQLDHMRDQGRLELTQTTTTTTITTVTAEEQEALDRRQESCAIQRKVYQRLGQHKHLRVCYLGTLKTLGSGLEDSLELTLASGLDELSGLEKMEFVSFRELNHRVGKAEDAWVKEGWKLSRRPGGSVWHRNTFQ